MVRGVSRWPGRAGRLDRPLESIDTGIVTTQRVLRENVGLTQTEAAAKARVSLATWRRWEADPERVSPDTASRCEAVLVAPEVTYDRAWLDEINASWGSRERLTPRQAAAIAISLDIWGDLYLGEWLDSSGDRTPLHEIAPFAFLDLRVMVLVAENPAWVALAKKRCHAVAQEMRSGVLPFDRPGCFFDEVIMAPALARAVDFLADESDSLEGLPAYERAATGDIDDEHDEDHLLVDDDWDAVSDGFDDAARFDAWEMPSYAAHPLLGAVLRERHPFEWFDLEFAPDRGLVDASPGGQPREAS